ncbi:ribonuclease Z [Flavisolibacter ginsenosidimutans]|uniref:Ribonuclease Z n=1 Tax=Flavisolibacter ginsenosidimutans TaxID=661481 RepID=A0A5B8UHE3_9BACT|nr:ribonuclease Z [Flavisolibacter ginsenosidimutans]QEC56057.1 ribonuclease Z [Flavisolibacter ginsenosidimutans]
MLSVTILGNNSAVPAFNRHPTSQVVSHDGTNYLVDCGEGTQIQMIKYKIRRGKITHIFISHLHGDHYFGLIGLINTFSLLSHKQEMHIYAPAPLQQIIEIQLKVADNILSYPLQFHTLTEPAVLVDNEKIKISCFRTTHRIECYGFLFEEKEGKRKLLIDKVQKQEIPVSFYSSLQAGLDYITPKGKRIPNEDVTANPEKGKKYAFCADTRYDESIIPHIYGADAIYHETTYLDNMRERAVERFHSTTKQAALIARKAMVKKLLIGHFSSKYATLEQFLQETKEVFPNTELALEGVTYNIH